MRIGRDGEYGTYVYIDSYYDCRWVWLVEKLELEEMKNCTVGQNDQPVSCQSLILGNGCPLFRGICRLNFLDSKSGSARRDDYLGDLKQRSFHCLKRPSCLGHS